MHGRAGRWALLGSAWLVTRTVLVLVVLQDMFRTPLIHHRLAADVRKDYFHAATAMVAHKIPYLGFHYEYPPGTLPLIYLSRRLSGPDSERFTLAWVGLALVADLLTLIVLATWARDRALPVGMVWVGGVAALGPVALLRNDLFVTTAFVLAAWLAATSRPVSSGVTWAAGILLKLWPAIPLAVLVAGRRAGRWRTAAAAAAVLASSLAALARAGAVRPMLTYLAGYQGQRPLEVESMWANAGWLYASVAGHHLRARETFGSFNLISPRTLVLAGWANHATTLLQAGVVSGVLVARRVGRRDLSYATLAWVWLASLAASFVLTPVLSPQYALWLVGAAAVVLLLDPGAAARRTAVLAIAVSGLSQVVYPFQFTPLLQGRPSGVTALTVRNATIVVLLVVVASELVRRARRGGGPAGVREPAWSPGTVPSAPRGTEVVGRGA